MVSNYIALDIGEKRIGIARAGAIARIPEPIATLLNNDSFKTEFNKIYDSQDSPVVVVGLPRNLDGQETAQSRYTRQFVDNNLNEYNIIWQDETLSSATAEMGPEGPHGLDADAACVILNDYLMENNEVQE